MNELDATCLCLAGPTAAGKSAAALAVVERLGRIDDAAPRLPMEIVSVDSALVYRGMDIGTAKPDADERARVRHHLIDIRDPAQRYSAAEFIADASRLIDEIRGRGAWPLFVGGTMLYFKALFDGLDALPAADAGVRAEIDAEAARDGWPALHAALARVDAAGAARLAPNDAQRIQRALEVYRLSGRPLSEWHTTPKKGLQPTLVSLEPDDRRWLHARIEKRFDAMLEAGFLAEVEALRGRGDLSPALPALRAVGYRQAWHALDAGAPLDLGALRTSAVAATRQLAKRQLTWLRSMSWRLVVPSDAADAVEQVVRIAEAWAGGRSGPASDRAAAAPHARTAAAT